VSWWGKFSGKNWLGFDRSFLASWCWLFFILFLSFEQSSHCRNNARHTSMLKKRKRIKEKKPKRSVQPTFIYKVNKLVSKFADLSAKKPAKSKARISLPVLKKS
jgi:hypothetical protein